MGNCNVGVAKHCNAGVAKRLAEAGADKIATGEVSRSQTHTPRILFLQTRTDGFTGKELFRCIHA